MKTNLIGISGKIGSGKGEVGVVLQYLNCLKLNTLAEHQKDYNDFRLLKVSNGLQSEYQIKKFDNKRKDIVCLLLGCTRDQLEKDLDKELGEEWNQPKHYGCKNYEPDDGGGNCSFCHCDEKPLTPRKLLQLLDTEAGRGIIHPSIWINALFADYKVSKRDFKDGDYIGGSCVDCGKLIGVSCAKRQLWCLTCSKKEDKPNWIITDVKRPDQAQAIKDRGGIVIRVDRGYALENEFDERTRMDNEQPSETALYDYEFDHVIDNNGSIEELVEKVKQLNIL